MSTFGYRPLVTWNPFFAGSFPRSGSSRPASIALDLLDDWTVHFAFAEVRQEVERAYERAFDSADSVFANSEGTLALAHRFGRSDTHLLLNGTDPERFSSVSHASGALTVGYVGKIGKRLDLDLITDMAGSFPEIRFVFAGPILDREYRAPLAALANIELLGDVHYDDVPGLLNSFDLGWVPHRVGTGEVGGDVIKTYEYRAAGLPVLSTPIVGVGDRGLSQVAVVPAGGHSDWLRANAAGKSRLPRRLESIPDEMTWRYKASTILKSVGVEHDA